VGVCCRQCYLYVSQARALHDLLSLADPASLGAPNESGGHKLRVGPDTLMLASL
jgi:hypothetical protein